jgi:hypothetical protein
MGYAFQFVTLAGFHALNLSMFELASGYREQGMAAYSRLQDREFDQQRAEGYAAVKHQSFVGTGRPDRERGGDVDGSPQQLDRSRPVLIGSAPGNRSRPILVLSCRRSGWFLSSDQEETG